MKINKLKNRLFKNFLGGLAIGVGILTSALLAVTVTGTFNTFSSGALLKSSDINANFSTLKAVIESIPSQPSMRLIYETDVTATVDNVNVPGLNGDVDKEYMILTRLISGTASSCSFGIRPNNISSTVYGRQYTGTAGTTPTGGRSINEDALITSGVLGSGQISYSQGFLFAKSGTTRAMFTKILNSLPAGSQTIPDSNFTSGVWNDTATNITSLNFVGTTTSCYGVGSHIEVWARR